MPHISSYHEYCIILGLETSTSQCSREIAIMSVEYDIYVTSRSRAPSIINVNSQNEAVFAHLPDLIQEAAVSTECKSDSSTFANLLTRIVSSPRLKINRVHDNNIDTTYMTEPIFSVTSRTDSGIDMPDISVTDEKVLGKYGSDLTANYEDIRIYGSKAFAQKQNISTGTTYSISACATGYIWVSVNFYHGFVGQYDSGDAAIQIGTFALKARTITTIEVPCEYTHLNHDDLLGGKLALLCATVLAKYLRLRIIGQQYEEAAESAIKESRRELSAFRVVDPRRIKGFDMLLARICTDAPMPPVSDVSLISRSMIARRWQCWRTSSVLRERYSFARRIVRCFRQPRNDSIGLLSRYHQDVGTAALKL